MNPVSIVIVEDLEEVREALKSCLLASPAFHLLSMYGTAEEAILHLADEKPDIVIMDINLPGMSGIECIRKVKKQQPDIRFIMFTIYENDEKVFEALKAGASGYLLKKTGLSSIPGALMELYEGGAPMSATIARKVVLYFQEGEKQLTGLSTRETEILRLLSQGLLYKEISEQLSITTGTVRQHIHSIYEKLHVQNKTEAINKLFGR